MIINLVDGSEIDINDIAWIERKGEGILVFFELYDEEYESFFYEDKDVKTIMEAVKELSCDLVDIE